MPEDKDHLHQTALLVAMACVLQIAESLIPHPVPGLRLGLANVITLITLVTMGFTSALEITVLRTILGSFMTGTFMAPGFVLSFAGGVASTCAMGLLYHVPGLGMSIVGISIAGALVHNLAQIGAAYLILVRHPGIFVFVPWLCIGAVFVGWLTGVVAGNVCYALKEGTIRPALPRAPLSHESLSSGRGLYAAGGSFVHGLSAGMKIVTLIIISLAVLVMNDLVAYAWIFLLMLGIAAAARAPLSFLLLTARRYIFLAVMAGFLPVFVNASGYAIFRVGFLNFTREGLDAGAVIFSRIMLLALFSALLARTTAPRDLGRALGEGLRPLRGIGISGERVARVFADAWMAIPVFWDISRDIIRGFDLGRFKDIRAIPDVLSAFMTKFYVEASTVVIPEKDAT